MLRVLICYVCLCGLLISCQMQTVLPGMEETLSKAGNNRKELFLVLRHYESQDDSLRLRAAQFLLENMADKGYLTGRSIEEYYNFIDSVYQIKQEEYDIPSKISEGKSGVELGCTDTVCRLFDSEY